MKSKWVRNIELRNVTDEVNQALDFIRRDTDTKSTAKAVKAAILSYERLATLYKEKAQECIELRKKLNCQQRSYKKAYENMVMATRTMATSIGKEFN